MRILVLAALVACSWAIASANAETTEFGEFRGEIVVRLLPDGRTIEVKAPFEFIDQKKQRWPVPAGYIADGASIPRGFWSIFGGPLDGAYRDASIVHDYYCENYREVFPENYKRDWKSVHRAFYDGMRARGVNEITAKIMYSAVYHWGPRWERQGDQVRLWRPWLPGGELEAAQVMSLKKLEKYIEDDNPSLEKIEDFKVINYSPGPWVGTEKGTNNK